MTATSASASVLTQLMDLEPDICKAAEKFSALYYEAFDARRNLVYKIYTDGANLVWNGNAVQGANDIGTFLSSLPESSFTIKSLDAQPIAEKFTGGGNGMLLCAAGTVRFGTRIHCFTQTFMLTSQDNKWQIISDRFRFID